MEMNIPLTFWDISLWFAAMSIVLLITSGVTSLHHGKPKIILNKRRLRNAAILMSALFLMTVGIRILEIIHW